LPKNKPLFAKCVVRLPGKALNVSYTDQGLRYTCNKFAKLLYFDNAFIVAKDGIPSIKGILNKSKDVYVEDFIPRDHFITTKIRWIDLDAQRAEFLWVNKGMALLYGTSVSG